MISRARHSGKSTGADYQQHTHSTKEGMGFQSCDADPDVWLRPVLASNRVTFYRHVLLCADNVLTMMEEPNAFAREELK